MDHPPDPTDEITQRMLEVLDQKAEAGAASQMARFVVATERMADHLRNQQSTCQRHVGTLDILSSKISQLDLTVSSLAEKLQQIIDSKEDRRKNWQVWIPFFVALTTLCGVLYSGWVGRSEIAKEQKALLSNQIQIADYLNQMNAAEQKEHAAP